MAVSQSSTWPVRFGDAVSFFDVSDGNTLGQSGGRLNAHMQEL